MVNLNQDALNRLRTRGINFSRTGSYPFIHPDISLEPPIVAQGEVFFDGVLKIGAFSGIYGGRLRHISIGRYCSIAPGFECGWDDHPSEWLTSSMLGYVPNIHGWRDFAKAPDEPLPRFASLRGVTELGNDVWIGQGAFVRSGVKIGHGAIVGARAVVTRDVPPYAVVVGQPAKILKYRFPEPLIQRMLEVQWWRYNLYEIPKMLLPDPNASLDHIQKQVEAGVLTEYKPTVVNSEDIKAL